MRLCLGCCWETAIVIVYIIQTQVSCWNYINQSKSNPKKQLMFEVGIRSYTGCTCYLVMIGGFETRHPESNQQSTLKDESNPTQLNFQFHFSPSDHRHMIRSIKITLDVNSHFISLP